MSKQVKLSRSELARGFRAHLARSRLLARIFLPDELTISLPSLGALVVRPRFLDSGDSAPLHWMRDSGPSCERLPLACGAGSGALFVERGLALGLVNAILGDPMPFVVRPLSRIERGIFEGVIVALLGRLAPAATIGLGAGELAEKDLAPFSIGISVAMQGRNGQARFCGTGAFFERAWTTLGSSLAPGQVLATLRLEVAHTQLSRAELNGVSEGDAIVFDEIGPLSPSEPWPVQARLGDLVVPADAYPDGSVGIADCATSETGENVNAPSEARDASGAVLRCEWATTSIKPSASVKMTAEIGSMDVRQGDETALLRGLLIGPGRTDQVQLRIGDTPWAEGDILTVGNEFAVRVTRKLAG